MTEVRLEWFEALPTRWDPELPWTDKELQRAAELLRAICLSNGGEVVADEPISPDEVRAHCLEQVQTSLGTLASRYANATWPSEDVWVYPESSDEFEAALPFVTPSRLRAKCDLNTASFAQLVALPGIGEEKAQAIIEYRRNRGRFRTVADVEKVHGIGEKGAKELARYVYVADVTEAPVRVNSPVLSAFREEPTFERYVQLVHRHQMSLSQFGVESQVDVKERIFRELEGLANLPTWRGRGVVRASGAFLASEVRERSEQARRVDAIRARASEDVSQGVLIADWQYPLFLKELFDHAASSVRVIMFFMRYEDEGRYPTTELLAALRAARERGVDVQVILDQSAEGSAVRSEVINEEAYDFFERNGIAVRWDSPERKTHTKLVVVDGQHVVLGSHNWTAGSFFLYDDTSIYLDSASLGDHYHRQFEELWQQYEPGDDT